MKWFEDLEKRKEKEIAKAIVDFQREIYLHIEETLTTEEFDFLQDYGEREILHSENKETFTLTNLNNLEDYECLKQLLQYLHETSLGVGSEPWKGYKLEILRSIFKKLDFKPQN